MAWDASPAVTSLAGRRVLVTGGGGFIGSHLCRMCRDAAADVHAAGRAAAPPSDAGGVHWTQADLADPDAARRLVATAQPEVVFHLAGHPHATRSLDAVLPTLRSNLLTTVHLLTALAEWQATQTHELRRVILTGSLEEPAGAADDPTPSSPYAAAKYAAGCYGRMFHRLYGTPVAVARTFMVYGPGQRDLKKLVPYVTTSLLRGEEARLSSGTRRVDWVYVEDVARGFVAAATAPGLEGQTFDLGTGLATPVREVAAMIARIVGRPERLAPGALPDRPMEQERVADVERTFSLTGWRPAVPLDEGLRRTVDWYRQGRV
jgi:nucleoside-diphosphate-sugar epimerase